MAAAGEAHVLRRRLAGDLGAGVEHPGHHGRVDVGDVAGKKPGADGHRHPGDADRVLGRQHRFDREPKCGTRFVERIKIERIGRGDHDRAVPALEWKQAVAMDELLRKLGQQRQIDLRGFQINQRHADLGTPGA